MFAAAALTSMLIPALAAQQKKAPPPKPEYAGSEMCGACHEEIAKTFAKTPHYIVETDKRRGFEGKACESCHGPGAKHAESADKKDILNPGKVAGEPGSKNCLGCHLNQPTRLGLLKNGHIRHQVGCASCHSVHLGTLVARSRREINQQCSGCHTDVWASFQRPHAHRLREGAMSCADCHNPHGSFLARAIRTEAGNSPNCISCHADKRGPFTFEHAPVRLEGCRACHEPHGSANPRMLTRAEVRYQCLECHSNIAGPQAASSAGTIGGVPPGLHDMRSPRYRNCTICHVKVHGSYVNRALLR